MRYGFNELNDETKSRGYTKVNRSVHSKSSGASKETTERRRLLNKRERSLRMEMLQLELQSIHQENASPIENATKISEKNKKLLPNQKAQQSKVKKSHLLKSGLKKPINSEEKDVI
ncbi:hypothetical protein JTB14_035227 [Gonioctena quinquepunctata]|nr:hypothetical protein JTB14_035227 [Gonioctena quinquepunctata]